MKQLLENNDKGHVVATCRNPNSSTGLLQLKDRFDDRLQILPLDLTVESSIEVVHFVILPLDLPIHLLNMTQIVEIIMDW